MKQKLGKADYYKSKIQSNLYNVDKRELHIYFKLNGHENPFLAVRL